MKRRRQAGAFVMTACLLGMASGAFADVFVPKENGGYWNQAATWSKAEGDSARTYPQHPYDTAAFTNNLGDSGYSIRMPDWGAWGCSKLVFYARPNYWTPVDVVTYYNKNGTMVFQSTNGPAVIHARNGTKINLGYRWESNGILTMQLKSDLLVTNDAVRDVVVTVGSTEGHYADARFTDDGTPHDIVVNACAQKKLTMSLKSSISTFRGTWYVIGPKTTLEVQASGSLGDAANPIVLRDGGNVALWAYARTLTRRLEGSGNVTAVVLTNGVAGVISPGENGVGTLNITADTSMLGGAGVVEVDLADNSTYDVVNFTGDLELGGALVVTTLGDYSPEIRQKWPVMTATGTIAGAFDSITKGFDVSVEAGSVMLRRSPPSGSTIIIQ
ncbi:MAG: hypothetical protein ACOX9C_00945 [Kiritimatiellia bacterium]